MEYKRIWLNFETVTSYYGSADPSECDSTRNADAEIAQLLNQGWRIVSTSPVTASRLDEFEGTLLVFTYTSGIEVFMIKE
jgi:tartrate dehydratase beta subunit/fumarate hydratase class I family protein